MSETQHKNAILTITASLPAKLSVDAYASAGVLDARLYKTKHLVIGATDDDLLVTIDGSVVGGATFPLTAKSEVELTAGTKQSVVLTTYYTHLNVRVKSKDNGQPGTLSTQMAAASF